ncbi:AAA family ATPase [Massilia jejuensis]|uniref:AAA family ATPase n=1 Tax=Massilia jejuensis TaxID=648894 RepID=A0ABW0PHC5_9BURK
MDVFYYSRPLLADQLVADLTGRNPFSDASNGLFLAAPRRTGKSTFLQNELRPALDRTGRVVVYVDLWSDKSRNPGALIADAVAAELQKHLGIVAKTAKAAGVDELNIAGWMKIDTKKIDGATLTDALRALCEMSGKPVALIIDEAQHSLTSEEGETAMTALKSARDQLNRPGNTRLLLVMSGSDRDKLLRLVNSNAAPFFGSAISRMPELDRDFIVHIASLVGRSYPHIMPIDVDTLWDAFQRLAHRPQPFLRVLGKVLNPLNSPAQGFERDVLELAESERANDERAMESAYLVLRPIEQAVLWRMFEQKDRFRPYDAEALTFYREKTGTKITAQKAQAAIASLRQQTPSLMWKSAKGEYALDDTGMYQWFEKRKRDGIWPPVGPDLEDASEQEEAEPPRM